MWFIGSGKLPVAAVQRMVCRDCGVRETEDELGQTPGERWPDRVRVMIMRAAQGLEEDVLEAEGGEECRRLLEVWMFDRASP